MAKNTMGVDMTRGSIWRQLVAFAIPMVIGQMFQMLYNTVDSVVVGQFVGKEALAAVGSTGSVINAVINFFVGLSGGAGVVISQYYGAHDDEGVSRAVHTTVLVTLIMAVFCTVLGMAMTDTILGWMDTPADVISDAADYLRIYFAGVAGVLLYNSGSGILRAVGDSKRPLYFLIFSAVLNLVLDLLFVCAFRMGVAGAAYATIISQALAALLTIVILLRSEESYRVEMRRLKMDVPVMRRIMAIGLPAGFQSGITALSNAFVQSYINAFQSACMAGWTAYNRLDAFAWLPMTCISTASTTFISQNLGAGNIRRAKKGASIALWLSMACTAVVVLLLMVFAEDALRLFNSDPEMLSYGKTFVLWLSPFYIIFCATQIYSGALRGAGDSVSPMVICIFSFVVCRQIYLYFITQWINLPVVVGLSFPVGWVLSATLMTLKYRFGGWEKRVNSLAQVSQDA